MPKINVLPKHIYELIAAGEVVERPASIVKELVENSIDAGATIINIEIQNGGISYIRVTDNGCGIAPSDLKTAFISHATSKIVDENDLFSIMTLGFRGEALPSIASVAQVEIITKIKSEQYGSRYSVNYGEEESFGQAGCPDGTTIIVKNLFARTPARMKFLKKDVAEGNVVSGLVDKLALSHPEISFRFIRDGKQILLTNGNGDLSNCIREVLGKEFYSNLIEVIGEYEGIRIKGFITKSEFAKSNRNYQYYFLNGRYIKSNLCTAALSEAYKSTIMVGKFPACVIFLELNPVEVDINVHPTKTEVRFSNEKAIFNSLFFSCKSSLDNNKSIKEFSFSNKSSSKPAISYITPEPLIKGSQIEINDAVNKHSSKSDICFEKINKTPSVFTAHAPEAEENETQINESLSDLLINCQKYLPDSNNNSKLCSAEFEESKNNENFDNLILIGEVFKTYIICQLDKKLFLIDKHASHERIIYEKLKNNSGNRSAQVLLSPVNVFLDSEDYNAIIANLSLLSQSGFECNDLGDGTVIVSECPMELSMDDIENVIIEIAGYLKHGKQKIEYEKLDWIFHSVACRSAIKAGDFTQRSEMEIFAKSVLNNDKIRFCPHGRPVVIEITEREIEKNFGRA